MGREIQQTDLAPTMSGALGMPPPAPSLGNVLLPVLPKMSISHTLLHIVNNLKQVRFISNIFFEMLLMPTVSMLILLFLILLIFLKFYNS